MIKFSKQAQERLAASPLGKRPPKNATIEELIEYGRMRGFADPIYKKSIDVVEHWRSRGTYPSRASDPPLCIGCGARHSPDEHGALPCGN